MEKYTIIVTVYNKEKYIERCLDTVCNQTFKNYRVMVVNDGSTDNSENIILKYQEKYNIDYYYKENSGVSDTRNFAVKNVKTEYFTFVDADDYVALDMLAEVDKYDNYDVLSYDGIKLTPEYNYIKSMAKSNFDGRGDYFLLRLLLDVCDFGVPWGYIYNTKYFKSHKFEYPYGRILEDFYLTPFVLSEAKRVISIEYTGYYYIETPNSIITSEANQEIIKNTYLDYYVMTNERLSSETYDERVKNEHKAFIIFTLIWFGSTLKGKPQKEFIEKMFSMNVFAYFKTRGLREKLVVTLLKLRLYYPLRKVGLALKKIINNPLFIFISKYIIKPIYWCIKKIIKSILWSINSLFKLFIKKLLPKKTLKKLKNTSAKEIVTNKMQNVKYKLKRKKHQIISKLRNIIKKLVVKLKTILNKLHIFYPIKWYIFLPIKYKIKYRNIKFTLQEFSRRKTFFYGDEHDSAQIAFVLKIKNYGILKNFNKKIFKAKYIFLKDDKAVRNFIKQNHLYKRRDYLFLEDVHRMLDNLYKRNYRPWRYKKYEKLVSIANKKLKTSELLIKAMYSPAVDIKCDNLEKWVYLDEKGDVWGCCPYWPTFKSGNILKDGADSFDNYFARIIKLTSLNRNYCFCQNYLCKFNHREEIEYKCEKYEVREKPYEITVAYDYTCNLKCPSCRTCLRKMTPKDKKKCDRISAQLKQSGWLEDAIIIVAGMGEVFYSKAYRELIQSDFKRNYVVLLSNGLLFNKENYELIKGKYKRVAAQISVDAATKETYFKIRGANFDVLMKNLEMISDLRQKNEIENFTINFVVQRNNYFEMKEMIRLGQKLHADNIHFTKLNNWGTYKNDEYLKLCMVIDDKYLVKELYDYLQDPIFNEPIVDIFAFKGLLKNSDELYGNSHNS